MDPIQALRQVRPPPSSQRVATRCPSYDDETTPAPVRAYFLCPLRFFLFFCCTRLHCGMLDRVP